MTRKNYLLYVEDIKMLTLKFYGKLQKTISWKIKLCLKSFFLRKN